MYFKLLMCLIGAEETFLLLLTVVLLNSFFGNCDDKIFRIFDEYKFQKNSIYLKCNIKNVFTVTFSQLNASLLN